jgi:phage terminase large subunit
METISLSSFASQHSKRVPATRIYSDNLEAKELTVVNVDGARSSKSYSLAQVICHYLANQSGKHIGICRKTFPALRMTAMELMLRLLKEYGMYNPLWHNKTANTYEYHGNLIQFFSLDDPEKIKSTEFNYIWMEEANEFAYEDYTILKLRMSGKCKDGESNHMYLSLNPVDGNNWIASKLIHENDVRVIHSTYKDNNFLDDSYRAMLEDLINQDENYYRVYVLGEWGSLDNLVYRNWKSVAALPEKLDAWAYGLDLGYNNPSAIVRVGIKDREVFVEERLYQTHMTNSQIIEFLSHEPRGDIYCDPTELQHIEEIKGAGYRAFPANKDVKLGIDLCKRQTLYITLDSANLIKEIQGYQYRKDRDGSVRDEPVKYADHLVDAMRYAVYGLVTRFGFATAAPRTAVAPVWWY